jgi:hypothetical protein
MEDKRCEYRCERAALGETFILVEEVPCVVWFAIPTFIGFTIDEIKEREEGTEFGVFF